MNEEWHGRKKPSATHEIGADLSAISLGELDERITLLRTEITRIEAEIVRKRESANEAHGAFRI